MQKSYNSSLVKPRFFKMAKSMPFLTAIYHHEGTKPQGQGGKHRVRTHHEVKCTRRKEREW